MRFGVAVTAYREDQRGGFAWLLDCLAAPAASPHVADVVVYDDTADAGHHGALAAALRGAGYGPERVRLERGAENLGVMGAKVESVRASRSGWVLMCDSDNVFPPASLALISGLEPSPETFYSPSFGRPALDYRAMVGRYALADVERFLSRPESGCAVNTGNQLVPRERFLVTVGREFEGPRWDLRLPDWLGVGDRSDLKWRVVYTTFDSGLINAAWWRSGGTVEIVHGLEYVHGSLTPEHQRAAPSSWERGPAEKERIPQAALRELVEAARAVAR